MWHALTVNKKNFLYNGDMCEQEIQNLYQRFSNKYLFTKHYITLTFSINCHIKLTFITVNRFYGIMQVHLTFSQKLNANTFTVFTIIFILNNIQEIIYTNHHFFIDKDSTHWHSGGGGSRGKWQWRTHKAMKVWSVADTVICLINNHGYPHDSA